jgi:hypothetical protein
MTLPTEIQPAETNIPGDIFDSVYAAYIKSEVAEYAHQLSRCYNELERLDANLAAILHVLRGTPKFKEALLKNFDHENWPFGSKQIIADIQNSKKLAETITGTLAGFMELANEYHPEGS